MLHKVACFKNNKFKMDSIKTLKSVHPITWAAT